MSAKGGKGPSNNGGKGKGDGKGDGGKGKGKGKGGRYGAYGGYKGASRKKASRMAQDEIRDVLQDIRNEIKQERREAQHDRKEVNREYRRTKGDVNLAFGESGEFMGQQNDIISGRFADAQSQQAAAQQALMGQLGQNAQKSLGGAGDELARLGLSGDFGNQAGADQLYAQQAAQLMNAGQQGNLDAMQGNAQSVGDMLLSMNSGAKANMLTQALVGRNDARHGIREDRNDTINDLQSQARQTKREKGSITREILQQLAQLGWAQYVDQRNLNQNQQQINMQRRQMNHSIGQSNRAEAQANQQQNAYSSTLASGLGTVLNGNRKRP